MVASTHAFGSWHSGALASAANQLAAMPSLHMAWATWCTLVLWRLTARRWVRILAIVYPCLTCFAVLATGNHFLADSRWGRGDDGRRRDAGSRGRGVVAIRDAHGPGGGQMSRSSRRCPLSVPEI